MPKRFYQFGPFRVDTHNHLLLRNNEIVPLKPKVFDTLLVLVENRGTVIDKDALISRLWPDTVVEDSNLTQNIYVLRRILGEASGDVTHIETIPKRGYRFIAPVSETDGEVAEIGQPATGSNATATRMSRQIMAASALAALVLMGLLAYFWWTRERTTDARQVKSLAVLPFRPIRNDEADETLGFGLADTLITRLSAIREVPVRPTSAIRAVNTQNSIAAGRELKVDGVLEGTVQRAGSTVRLTLRLIRVSDGSTIWADQFDEPADDILALQDRLADDVSRVLVPMVAGNERRRLAKRYTSNSEAYQLYLIGRHHWSKVNTEDWLKAIEYFQRAIQKDSNYALAYAGLADCYMSVVADARLPKAEAIANARRAATMAVDLDDELAEAHVSLGRIKAYYDWDWAGARKEFTRAIELDPNSADAHREYAAYLTTTGRGEIAVPEALRATDLDPLSYVSHFEVVWALIGARRYEDAIAHANSVLATFPPAHYWVGMADLGLDRYADAIQHLETSLSRSTAESLTKAFLGYAYAATGRRVEAERILSDLTATAQHGEGAPYLVAMVYAGMGDRNSAFAWLDKSFAQRSRLLDGLKVNPVWKHLRGDARFGELLRRIGLPE